ncbi:hypothetical protein ACFVUS_12600 [Nocardia sp. NPDC058058]|uniref:hypothetical protein n=1 Tax=Nocardia sp. NPDC058058 TaxID=3346317 RepID=UPI0036D76197
MAARYDALPLALDVEHLSQTGELMALLLRLKTWHIVYPHIYRRNSFAIRDEPFPRLGYILREHRCGLSAPTGEALALPPPRPSDHPGF